MEPIPSLNVVAIGGAHQFPHILPVAFDLHASGAAKVRVFVPTAEDAEAVERLAARLGVISAPITIMALPRWVERILRLGARRLDKAARLIFWQRFLRSSDGLLSAERTSTLLKQLPGRCPTFVHIPHGAGDRAVGFEKRLALFDHVIVAGEKDRQRMVELGIVAPERCHVGGPVKVASLGFSGPAPRLFRNDRPTVLYNPHFTGRLGSFDSHAQRIIDTICADGRYNLVVAPHVRLSKGWSHQEIEEWQAKSIADRIIVDMGSERSIDMSYTRSADVYLGDVSSQVYEFLVNPRPAAFINAHGVEWRDDPDYAMWNFGPVAEPDDDPIAVIDRAISTHEEFRATQEKRVADALSLENGIAGLDGVVGKVATMVANLIRPAVPNDR